MSKQTCCDKNMGEQFTCGQLRDEVMVLERKLAHKQEQVDQLAHEVLEFESELAEARAELEEASTIANDNYQVILKCNAQINDYKRQLAEVRAELERIGSVLGLQEYTKHIRQEAAREVLEILRADRWAESELKEIIEKFGLEG